MDISAIRAHINPDRSIRVPERTGGTFPAFLIPAVEHAVSSTTALDDVLVRGRLQIVVTGELVTAQWTPNS